MRRLGGPIVNINRSALYGQASARGGLDFNFKPFASTVIALFLCGSVDFIVATSSSSKREREAASRAKRPPTSTNKKRTRRI